MRKQKQIKYVHEGEYVAEVDVELIESEDEWAPYLSLNDAYKLDDVREDLSRGDLALAAQKSRVFRKYPIAV